MVNHDASRHPNVPCYGRAWSDSQVLHVAAMYSNPVRWNARRRLFHDFRCHMSQSPNVRLHVGEIAYGDRPFEVTDASNPLDFQFRVKDELWHKENLLNLVVQRFPQDWKYGAYIDGDFHFTRHDWALETVHQLQTYDWVQMFSTYTDLSDQHRPLNQLPGFVYATANGLDVHGRPKGQSGWPGAPGGCWAFNRDAFNRVGGLLDNCVLGSADHHMAIGLAGTLGRPHPDTDKCGVEYRKAIRIWQERAADSIKGNLGYLDCHVIHHFHGPKSKRGYEWRWQILRDRNFNPQTDIYRDWQGLWQLTPGNVGLRDDIRRYFRSRVEDQLHTRDGAP